MNRQEILSSEAYWTELIQNRLFHEVHQYLKRNNKTQNDLAQQLGVSKSYISQILHGNFDHKLSKFIELSLAIGLVPEVSFKALNDVIAGESERSLKQEPDFQMPFQNGTELSKLSSIPENGEDFTDAYDDMGDTEDNNEYSRTA
ncbi:MAG: helix-turn-helix domain-containing protein [Bacteroidia bacterium]